MEVKESGEPDNQPTRAVDQQPRPTIPPVASPAKGSQDSEALDPGVTPGADANPEPKPSPPTVTRQPRPISPLTLPSKPPTHPAQKALDVLCCPCTLPVCLCDFLCYTCFEGVFDARVPGGCTACAQHCVPCAFVSDFTERREALRSYEWCRGHGCTRILLEVVRVPCCLVCAVCACCGHG